MTREAIYQAALEEFREEAARCRTGHRMVMVSTIENIIRRTDEALEAAAKVPAAKTGRRADGRQCSRCGGLASFCRHD